MPALTLFPPFVFKETIRIGYVLFDVTIWLSPSELVGTNRIEEEFFVNLLTIDNQLGTTRQEVCDHLRDGDYSAILSVRNAVYKDDHVTAALQYYPWLSTLETKEQVWLTDLSRSPKNKRRVSPAHALLHAITEILAEKNINRVFLMTNKPRLVEHYSKAYGFQVRPEIIDSHTVMESLSNKLENADCKGERSRCDCPRSISISRVRTR